MADRALAPLLLLFGIFLNPPAYAAQGIAHGYTPKYSPGFDHFDYVDAQAPKGGTIVLSAPGSFDKLNPYTLKGVSAVGLGELVFETLMVQSLDEPYSLYAHVAEDVSFAPDRLSVTFRLNPSARFSNDKPVLADDVKYSFDVLKSKHAHPQFRFYWADVKQAVVLGPRVVRFDFVQPNPELHFVVAQMPIFSRDWTGGKPFDAVITERPIGSGPYVINEVDFGKRIAYERNPNYWARNLNTSRGMYNFDRIVFKYYKDETVRFEAFKAHEYDFIYENNSKRWARGYVGTQFTDGRIIRDQFRHHNNAGMQGFVFNLRRKMFTDKRVRRAMALAMDFEWSNKNLFYGQYTRCDSYFSNSELAARGLPSKEELALLEPLREKIDPAVFTQVWRPPNTDAPNSLRANLREAQALLEAAGWKLHGGVLQNAAGQRLEFEVLLAQTNKAFERILAPYARNLAKLGIKMNYRTADNALYQNRTDTFDYDMIVHTLGQSQSPGNELINVWHASSADKEGSNNTMGLKDPAVDALLEKLIYASDRKHLVTAAQALDRVLLHGEYIVPNWYIANHRTAYWSGLAYPEKLPLYYDADGWMLRMWWKKPQVNTP